MQTDRRLNRKILRKIVNERRRAVASLPGLDLTTVLRHAIAADKRRFATDCLVVAVLVIMLAVVFAAPELIVPTILVALILVGGGVFLENYIIHYRVLARTLRREVFDAAAGPAGFRPKTLERLYEIKAQDGGNVTVYPDYSPFIGYGHILTTWSFVLNVAKPAQGKTVTSFSVEEVYDHVAEQVRLLGLPGVVVKNQVLVNGDDLLCGIDPFVERVILPDEFSAPMHSVSDGLVRHLMSNQRGRARTCLSICVTGWGGELALTVFLRFAMSPRKDLLFVEASYSLLPPIKEKYRRVDRLLSSPTVKQVASLVGMSVVQAPLRIFTSIGTVISAALASMRVDLVDRREIEEIRDYRSFNYGALVSARELAGNDKYFRYFQRLDKEMYPGTVDRRVFDAITELLESRGVDTAQLTARQTTILNHGIFVSGHGSISAYSIAAEQDPRAHTIGSIRMPSHGGGDHE